MSKKIVLLSIFSIFMIACNSKSSSLGGINKLTIICSDEDKAQSQHIIEYFFNKRIIMTPQAEAIYSIDWIDLKQINKAKLNKNILLLSLDYPADSTIDILVEKIINQNKVADNVSSLKDLFANQQKVIIVKAVDTIDLENKIHTYFHWITSEYNQNIYSNYYDYIISKDIQNTDIEKLLNKKFNISMFVQEDYELIKDANDFVWIGRGFPYRWILFYKLNNVEVEEYRSQSYFSQYKLLEEILAFNNVGIHLENQYRKKTKLIYNKAESYVYRGIYSHLESDTGGPFASYLLDNIDSNEVILVTVIINNPGNNKMQHLLQMDALIKNIKF